MTPTQKQVTEAEYHECSSDSCTVCYNKFYIMACGYDISLAYECPYCGERVKAITLREAYRAVTFAKLECTRLTEEKA